MIKVYFINIIKGISCALLCLILASSCGKTAAELDQQENTHPLLEKAKRKLAARDVNGALEVYNEALSSNPGMAKAHLEMGLIYDEHKEDYVRAIYHYQRYLELRPNTQKSEMIEKSIRHARMAFAVSLADRPSDAVNEISQLRIELKNLKNNSKSLEAQVNQLQGGLKTSREELRIAQKESEAAKASEAEMFARIKGYESRIKAAIAAKKLSTTQVVVPSKPVRISSYTVKTGDSLSKISQKVYGASDQWDKIYNANKSKMKHPKDLKAGQVLKIP